ncbi:putative disease resistance protein RGA3 [Ricinus communis]|uniref:putative disease resistance protein RGA3 n=1 Tax=Ricinus communis TaxID=3988 RepID=UPI00201ABA65|nr:putative disease resistance protein RGA3 [Ricinus communis]
MWLAALIKRIWVCVSDPFDEIRVAKAILESLKGSAPDVVELQNILEQIERYIKGKRFLLVLDDLWSEESQKWEQLKYTLLCGSPGSRILATTRKKNVAKIIGCSESDMFSLGQLSEEECWSLEIVAKCKGLHLAAKTIGSLCSGKSRGELQSILESEVWELEEAEVDLFPHLWLSYYDLPSALRQCFSYCTAFPKDYRLEMIQSWMAQGYLREKRTEDMEKIGEKYFQELAMHGSIVACHMHDIVHDFAQFIIKNECFVLEANDSEDASINPFPKGARHSRIVLGDVPPLSLNGLKRLHSLEVQCSGTTVPPSPKSKAKGTEFDNKALQISDITIATRYL